MRRNRRSRLSVKPRLCLARPQSLRIASQRIASQRIEIWHRLEPTSLQVGCGRVGVASSASLDLRPCVCGRSNLWSSGVSEQTRRCKCVWSSVSRWNADLPWSMQRDAEAYADGCGARMVEKMRWSSSWVYE